MGNPVVHYAAGLAVATAFGYRGRHRLLLGLFALVPDLDGLTAIPWLIAAPHLGLGADALTWLGWTFGHRGLAHSFAAAGLAGVVAGAWTRSGRWGTTAFVAWSSHLLLDLVSLVAIHPLLPLSGRAVGLPLVEENDPLVTLVSLVIVAAALAPLLASMVRDRAVRARIERLAGRAGPIALVALPVALVVSGSLVPMTAWTSPAEMEQTLPHLAPRTVVITPQDQTYQVAYRNHPWDDPRLETVQRITTGSNVTREGAQAYADAAICTMGRLGPWNGIDRPASTIEAQGANTTVEVTDVKRNATQGTDAAIVLTFRQGRAAEASVAPVIGARLGLTFDVPQAVLQRAACPVDGPPAS